MQRIRILGRHAAKSAWVCLAAGVGAAVWVCAAACAVCLAFLVTAEAMAGDEKDFGGLPNYREEVELLVDVPGASSSLGAGLFNPAAWAVQRHGGLFVSWTDRVQMRNDPKDWIGILSARNLAFAMQRFQLQDSERQWTHLDEYTLGLGWGHRSHAGGISYSWSNGGRGLMKRHRRIVLGSVSRWRPLSLGAFGTVDLEEKNNFVQADIGLRPFGPRFTLFVDAVLAYGQSAEDITVGYGFEALPIPGLALAGKLRDDGHYSLRLGIGITGGLRPSVRMKLDDGGDHITTTSVLEMGGYRPPVGYGLFRKGRCYPEMSLRGRMTYRRYRLFDDRRSFLGTLNRINSYAENPRVGGVVINLSGMRINGEMLWELREQLAGLRGRGKKVIVYLDRVGMSAYALASVADQIWMDPRGHLQLGGLSAGRTYYRNMLDKLGLGIDELRFFTYKSAFETFSRTSMSDADREQFQTLIDDVYETGAEAVTCSRGVTRREWDRIIDEMTLLLPQEALEAGLIDSIGTFDQARKSAMKTRRRATPDPSKAGLAGVMGDPVWEPQEWGEPPRIAILYAVGTCSMESGIKARLLSERIKAARKDPRVKAVVLRADSPGGDPLPSDLVARELQETSKVKPVIVSQGSVAGSGGYWISMYADTIVAAPVTLTGSIGVTGAWVWNKGLGDKIGLTYDGVKRGEHSDLLRGIRLPLIDQVVPERPLTSEERDRAEYKIRALYKEFLAKVAESRGMTEEEVDEVGQGRIWSGVRGKENGLVDEIGGLWESLRIAKAAAGIPENRSVMVTQAPRLGYLNPRMFKRSVIGLLAEVIHKDEKPVGCPDAHPEDGPWSLSPEDSWARMILGDDEFRMLPEAKRTYLEFLLRSRGRPIMIMDPIEIGADEDPR